MALVAGGCAPVTTFYKPGVTLGLLAQDQTTCDVQALQKVPTALGKVQGPPTVIPADKICDADGNCRVFAPEIVPGRIRTVDLNADLRARVSGQCMTQKGYDVVTLPICPSGIQTSGSTQVLPTLSDRSCAILKNQEISAIINR